VSAVSDVEVVIRIPANSSIAKDLISLITKSVESNTAKVEVKEVRQGKKELTPDEQKKLEELKTILEIAKARGQEDLVKETEAEIRALES
jgi:hypothetical protein